MKQLYKQTGISIVSLLAGVAVSAGLLLAIGHLAYVSKHNFTQAKNIIEMNQNGRDAIEFLRKNIEMAGVGIAQPVPFGNVKTGTNLFPTGTPGGGFAVLPEWTAVGLVADDYLGPFGSTLVTGATPQTCATYVDDNFNDDTQFFSLWFCGECHASSDPNYYFDPTWAEISNSFADMTCCRPSGASCDANYSNCESPYYSCGAYNSQGTVYQKLKKSNCVGIGCAGADPDANPSGDILTVYFANTGLSVMKSFTDQNIPTDTYIPPVKLYSYSFYVDSNTSTLLAGDSLQTDGVGVIPNTNIAPNIEYMAVMLGESDLTSTVNSTYSAPQINRYVRPDTANLYSYRVAAVRVALVVRSTDQILDAVPDNTDITLMYGNDGDPLIYTAPADHYLRKVFTTTIFLKNYNLPVYQPHCVNVGGDYYIKTGGIPFATTWTTNDQCFGGAPCPVYDFETCENTRMGNN